MNERKMKIHLFFALTLALAASSMPNPTPLPPSPLPSVPTLLPHTISPMSSPSSVLPTNPSSTITTKAIYASSLSKLSELDGINELKRRQFGGMGGFIGEPWYTDTTPQAWCGNPFFEGTIRTRYCGRSEMPHYPNNTLNPYESDAWVTTSTLAKQCSALWNSSYAPWLNTASVTYSGPLHSAENNAFIVTGYTETTVETIDISPTLTYLTTENGMAFHDTTGIMSTTTFTSTRPWSTLWDMNRIAFSDAFYVEDFTWKAETPCCWSCTLYGGDVQVYNWPIQTAAPTPTPTPTPKATPQWSNTTTAKFAGTLVDKVNNFTFVSPSIYVGFKSLFATNYCGTLGGTVFPSTILSFRTDELSTNLILTYTTDQWSMPMLTTTDFTQANWATSKTCTQIESTFWQVYWDTTTYDNPAAASAFAATDTRLVYITDSLGYDSLINIQQFTEPLVKPYTVTFNPCSPLLKVPTQLYTINPLWTGCLPGITAFFDPPYTLTPGGDLSVFTSAAPGQPQPVVTTTTSQAAVVGGGVGNPGPSQTSTSIPDPVTTSTQAIIPVQVQSTSTSVSAAAVDPGTNNPAPAPVTSSSAIDPGVNNPPQQTTTSNPIDPAVITSTSTSRPAPVITFGTTQITADSSSNFIIASQTLAPGSQITVSSTVLSLATNGATLVVGGTSTQILSPSPTSTPAAVITLGTTQITADPSSHFIIGTQTLAPGSQITVSNTVLSLASNRATLVVGGTSTQLISPSVPTNPPAAVITIGTSRITANPSSQFVIGTQTLAPGSQITVSNTILSLASNGATLVIGGTSTQIIAPAQTTGVESVVVTFVGTDYILGTQTLHPGGSAITVSGTTFSLAIGGSSVVVDGTKTEAASVLIGQGAKTTTGLETVTTQVTATAGGSNGGIGGWIASLGGFVGVSTIGPVTTGAPFNGSVFLGEGTSMRGISGWGLICNFMVGWVGVGVWVLYR